MTKACNALNAFLGSDQRRASSSVYIPTDRAFQALKSLLVHIMGNNVEIHLSTNQFW